MTSWGDCDPSPPFKPGDIVRFRNGRAPIEVTHVKTLPDCRGNTTAAMLKGTYYQTKRGRYADMYPAQTIRFRSVTDFVRYEGDPEKYYSGKPLQEIQAEAKPEKEEPMTKLYQVIAEPQRYGTYLTDNSQGQIVLEMKGAGGAVAAFRPDELEEVVPYTVGLRIMRNGGNTQHYTAKKGVLTVGDWLILSDGTRARVDQLDTKCRKAQEWPAGTRHLMTEPIDMEPVTEPGTDPDVEPVVDAG